MASAVKASISEVRPALNTYTAYIRYGAVMFRIHKHKKRKPGVKIRGKTGRERTYAEDTDTDSRTYPVFCDM